MSAICRKSWPSMSGISTAGARTARLDNVRPAHQRQKMPLIEAIKLQSSSGYPCSEASITFISKRHNGSVPFLRPTGPMWWAFHSQEPGAPPHRRNYRANHPFGGRERCIFSLTASASLRVAILPYEPVALPSRRPRQHEIHCVGTKHVPHSQVIQPPKRQALLKCFYSTSLKSRVRDRPIRKSVSHKV
jgi:hypothetical protein